MNASTFCLPVSSRGEVCRFTKTAIGMRDHTMDESKQPGAETPFWDRDRKELRIGNFVVKRFRWPAENQERVLNAFQEEGWPSRIDDPIVPHANICPKRRLHDTLKCLNRKQDNEIIKFRGDGTGQGVLLEINWKAINGDQAFQNETGKI